MQRDRHYNVDSVLEIIDGLKKTNILGKKLYTKFDFGFDIPEMLEKMIWYVVQNTYTISYSN